MRCTQNKVFQVETTEHMTSSKLEYSLRTI